MSQLEVWVFTLALATTVYKFLLMRHKAPSITAARLKYFPAIRMANASGAAQAPPTFKLVLVGDGGTGKVGNVASFTGLSYCPGSQARLSTLEV